MNKTLILRRAEMKDSQDILSWRNDPHSLAMFLNSEPVTDEEHQSWFLHALQNPARILLIAEKEGQKIGIVRFDLQANQPAIVSINLNPVSRGHGLGAATLLLAESYLPRDVSVLLAEIKSINAASRRSFEKAGYRHDEASDEPLRYLKILSYNAK